MPRKRIAAVIRATSTHYLEAENLVFSGVETIEEAHALIVEGDVDAVVFEALVLLHYANTAGRGRVRVFGSIFEEDAYAFALPTGNELREAINQSLQ